MTADLAPRDVTELADALATAHSDARPVRIVGGGTRLPADAGAPGGAGVTLLSCRGLAGIRELDRAEGVVEVGAGTCLADLEAEVAEAGWHVPLEGVAEESTVGGALASVGLGMRALREGAARDHVLGMRIVDGTGQISKCGGRVVKNVTGYDLAKLYVGSEGSLGVIESTWLHLRPRSRTSCKRAYAVMREPFAIGLEAARRPSASAVLLASPSVERAAVAQADQTWRVFVELAGDEAVCEADAEWFDGAALGGASAELEPEPATFERALAEHVRVRPARDRLSVRVHVLPTRVHALCMRLVDHGAAVVAAPLPGFAVATWRGSEATGSALRATTDAALQLDGTGFILSAPPDLATEEAFAPAPDAAALIAKLRSRFDPAGILAPARPGTGR